MNTIRAIEQAFLTEFVTLGLTPVATENAPLDVETRVDPWYRVTSLPGYPTRPGIGAEGNQRYVGVIQVDVFWPKSQGDGYAKEQADAIADHFKVGTVLAGAVVTNSARLAASGAEDRWYMVPVHITYRADSANTGG